jgi:hypothetical protein
MVHEYKLRDLLYTSTVTVMVPKPSRTQAQRKEKECAQNSGGQSFWTGITKKVKDMGV